LGAKNTFETKYQKKIVSIPFDFDININKIKFNKFQHEKTVISVVGLVCPSKGCHYLLEAIKRINPERFKIKFIGQCSNKDYISYLRNICKEVEIEFTGFIRGSNFLSNIQDSHFSVFPSVSEGLPLSSFDIVKSGKPLIYSNLSNIEELLGPSFKYKYNDTERLAELILDMQKNSEMNFNVILKFIKNSPASHKSYASKWIDLLNET